MHYIRFASISVGLFTDRLVSSGTFYKASEICIYMCFDLASFHDLYVVFASRFH